MVSGEAIFIAVMYALGLLLMAGVYELRFRQIDKRIKELEK